MADIEHLILQLKYAPSTLSNPDVAWTIYPFSVLSKRFFYAVFFMSVLFFFLFFLHHAPELFLERLLEKHSEYCESGRQPITVDLGGVGSISRELDTLTLRLAHWSSLQRPLVCVCASLCKSSSKCCQW